MLPGFFIFWNINHSWVANICFTEYSRRSKCQRCILIYLCRVEKGKSSAGNMIIINRDGWLVRANQFLRNFHSRAGTISDTCSARRKYTGYGAKHRHRAQSMRMNTRYVLLAKWNECSPLVNINLHGWLLRPEIFG